MESLKPARPLTPPWQSLELHPRLVRIVPMSREKVKGLRAPSGVTRIGARTVNSPRWTWRLVSPDAREVTRPAASTRTIPVEAGENRLRGVTSRSRPSAPRPRTSTRCDAPGPERTTSSGSRRSDRTVDEPVDAVAQAPTRTAAITGKNENRTKLEVFIGTMPRPADGLRLRRSQVNPGSEEESCPPRAGGRSGLPTWDGPESSQTGAGEWVEPGDPLATLT